MILIIDDFLQDADLIDRINADSRWTDQKFPPSYYTKSNTPSDALEEYIKAVWVDQEWLSKLLDEDTHGFEYWGWDLNAKQKQTAVMVHVDYDEREYHGGNNDDATLAPFITVYYPFVSDDLEGGELHLFTEQKHDEIDWTGWDGTPEHQVRMLGKPMKIECKPNRLIIASGQYFHFVSEVTKGHRRSLNINPWKRETTFDINDTYTRK